MNLESCSAKPTDPLTILGRVHEKPILTGGSNNTPNNTNFTVKKATERNILGCNSEEKEIKKWTSEIVVIMDSNRKLLSLKSSFQTKRPLY